MKALKRDPTLGLLALACLLSLAAAGASTGCSSSSSSGGRADAGDDGNSTYGSTDDGAADGPSDAGGGGGDGAGEASVCVVPAAAVMMTQTEAGVVGCSATTVNTQCDPDYRLFCRAPIPGDVPVPSSSLGCTLQPNTGDPAAQYYCCPCK